MLNSCPISRIQFKDLKCPPNCQTSATRSATKLRCTEWRGSKASELGCQPRFQTSRPHSHALRRDRGCPNVDLSARAVNSTSSKNIRGRHFLSRHTRASTESPVSGTDSCIYAKVLHSLVYCDLRRAMRAFATASLYCDSSNSTKCQTLANSY